VKIIYYESDDDIFQNFDNYEISPCLIVGKDKSGRIIYEQCSFTSKEIAIWCVFGHFHTGGLECISDHKTFDEAEKFRRTLPSLY
jgi:hypothetical protein